MRRCVLRPLILAALGTVLMSTLVACAPGSSPRADPTPSHSSTVSLDLAPDAPHTAAQAQASADAVMLGADEIPDGPWTKDGPVATDDFRQWVCGVDTEPNPPVMSFVARWLSPEHGRMLFQSVRPIGATRAEQLITALDAAVRACQQDRRVKGEAVYTYDITRLPVSSAHAVAYRQRQTTGAVAVTDVDLVYFVERDSLVVFTVFSDRTPAGPDVLDGLVAAVRAKR
ncbi:MAG: hypothetical protein QM708_15190 [Propioniciclava sp.]|uniref:hypothetical protein n=1 Tax=Propioniciclava sp. TaxID=2038686 RepID=UPI0039E303DA